jgi:threonine synthase
MSFTTDRPPSWQVCIRCGNETVELDPSPRCRACGGLLEVRHRAPKLTREELIRRFTERRGGPRGAGSVSGVWRFREMVMPSVELIVSHPEGNTPLLHRTAVDEYTGVDQLMMKHEGHNPTGSFKDRGMTVGVTQALRIGARAVACASTGNTAASMAAYAAQARMAALVLVPADGISEGKLAQALAYGARTLLVRGDFDVCLRLVEEASSKLGVYLLNSINPYRLEGQKTIILEMLQQMAWEPPAWIVLPAGNLGNLAAFGKGLRELHEYGVITRMPRLVGVQAAGAAPFVKSFEDDFRTRHTMRADTVASAIRIGDPASYDRAVQSIRETDGMAIAVTDAEILEAKAAVDLSGIGCEPASAAAVAGIRKLTERGTIGRHERVVAVLTGHILKDVGVLRVAGGAGNVPVTIDPTLAAVEQAIRADR